MSPRGRVRRRPDHWSSPHERARVRSAERLYAPLSASEDAWLEAHLAECAPCGAIAAAYVTDRLALRELREAAPEPPRDLWARTAAGIERGSAARGRAARSPGGRRRSLPALGALSGLAVVTVVVIATVVSGGFLGRVGDGVVTSASPVPPASQEPGPGPTAMAVGAGKVYWLGTGADGAFAYNVADVLAVCPYDRQPDCAPFADTNARRVTLSATPKFIFQSPISDQAIVVGTDAAGSDAILVVALPRSDPTPEPTPDPATAPAEPPPTTPSAEPSATDTAIAGDTPTPASDIASASPAASGEPIASEPISPEPSAEAVAIITDVIVVGRSAAYSPDGAWFAFSARPADGSVGPDIYVWHVGDLQARPLTTDHASVFASWVGGSLLGNRLSPEPVGEPGETPPVEPTPEIPPPIEVSPLPDASPPAEATPVPERLPQAFLVDPVTGAEIALFEADWQPAVDPTGLAVVAWQGTVGIGGDGRTVGPVTGNLVIHRFHEPLESDEPLASSSASPDVSPTPSPEPSAEPSGDVLPSASPPVALDFPAQIVAAGPIADFDVRWDDTGSWLGLWIADPIDPTFGRLSLLHFDRATGLVDRPEGAPQDVTALPGFSIGLGRMAWVTPPGQGGEGSRIQIAAWTSDEVGAIESVPVEGAIVVQ